MRLYFARHGESEANVTRTFSNRDAWHPLTARGLEDAYRLADLLADTAIEAIYCSSAVRARQTAEIVGARAGLTANVADELREFDVGRWEGTDSDEGWAEYRQVVDAWMRGDGARRISDGENLHDIVARVTAWMRQASELHRESDAVLAVTHGGLLHAALPGIVAGCDIRWWRERPLGHCDVVVAEQGEGGWRCLSWGAV
jgi:probable phosphoglycerate mutase